MLKLEKLDKLTRIKEYLLIKLTNLAEIQGSCYQVQRCKVL